MALTNISNNTPVNKESLQILDNNFEFLRQKYNSAIPRINSFLDRLKPPYRRDLLAVISENDLIKLAEKDTLTAEDLNHNFNLFRNNLLLIGVKNLHKDITILDDLPMLAMLLPSAPINLSGELSDDGETAVEGLTWTDTSNCEAGFELYERSNNEWYLKETPMQNAEFSETELIRNFEYEIGDMLFPELDTDKDYGWKARAWNAYGYSEFSNVAEYASLPQPNIGFNTLRIIRPVSDPPSDANPTSTPATPSLSITAQDSSTFYLSWTNVSNELGYEIWSSTNGSSYSLLTTVSANITTATYSYSGQNTYYKVRAYNSLGFGSYSNTVNTSTAYSPPSTPSLNSSGSGSSCTLSWSASRATSYTLYKSVDNKATWTQVYSGSNTGYTDVFYDYNQTPIISSITDGGVSPYGQHAFWYGIDYPINTSASDIYYKVIAHNSIGDSGYSNIVHSYASMSSLGSVYCKTNTGAYLTSNYSQYFVESGHLRFTGAWEIANSDLPVSIEVWLQNGSLKTASATANLPPS